jgi:hypothetical protein
VWERLIAEGGEFRRLAARALEILHFDPSTGQALPDWENRCTAACYDCLLASEEPQEGWPVIDQADVWQGLSEEEDVADKSGVVAICVESREEAERAGDTRRAAGVDVFASSNGSASTLSRYAAQLTVAESPFRDLATTVAVGTA